MNNKFMTEVRVKSKKLNWKNVIAWFFAFFVLSNPSISIFNAISHNFTKPEQSEIAADRSTDNTNHSSEISSEESLSEIDFILLFLGIFLLIYLSREPEIKKVEFQGLSIEFGEVLKARIDNIEQEIKKERVLISAIIDGWKYNTLNTLNGLKKKGTFYDVNFNRDMQQQLRELYGIGFIQIVSEENLTSVWENVFNPKLEKDKLDVRKYFEISHRGKAYLELYSDEKLCFVKPDIKKVNEQGDVMLDFDYEANE